MTTTLTPDVPSDSLLGAETQPSQKRSSPALPRWRLPLIVVLFLLVHISLGFHCAMEDFASWDEIGNLTAGLSYWQTGSYWLYNVNPPLPKVLASLPVLLANPDTRALPNTQKPDYPGDRPEYKVGESFARDNIAQYHGFIVRARSVGLLWSLLGALGVYCWATALWGRAGGLLALAVWCFEPNIMAQGHLLKNDLPAAVAALWAAYLFRGYLLDPSWSVTVLAGLVLGLAELCKFTLLLFYPTWCALWLFFVLPRRCGREKGSGLVASLGQLGLIFALSLWVLNAGYEFAGTGRRLKEFRFVSEALAGPWKEWKVEEGTTFGNRFAGTALGDLVVPLPEDMVCGIDVQRRGTEWNRHKSNKYLRGEWSQNGWWYYYLYAAAVKVPLGLWGLLLFALAMPLWDRSTRRLSWGELLALWLPALVIFIFVSSHPSMQPNPRYVLPAFPFAIIYLGRAGQALVAARWGSRLIVAGLFLWAAGSYLSVHPHSIAYFNELAGGPDKGHNHLLSSNIDVGQDLFRLKRWLNEHPEAKSLKLAYFNHVNPRILGIDFELPPLGVTNGVPTDRQAAQRLGPHPGYFAVSVRFVRGAQLFAPNGQGKYSTAPLHSLEYFHQFQPIAKAGYSIFIYHITLEEANRLRQQYGLPPLPANGDVAVEP